VQGLGGWKTPQTESLGAGDIPADAMAAMNASALQAIQSKAGNRLPIIRGKDTGLPKAAPVFDLDAMRKRNAEVIVKMSERRPTDG
jgi:hypothetical protein